MKIVVTTMYYSNYFELARATVHQNLAWYCERLGYTFVPYALSDEVDPDPYKMACKACVKNTELILKTLEDHPDCDYVFHRDCDSIILNMNRRIEDIVAEYPKEIEILFGGDKAGLSAGQMIVKNTPQVKAYLQEYLDHKAQYEHEQDFYQKNLRDFIVITPQHIMNSYDCVARLENPNDPANFRDGDFLVHLAGLNLEQKMSVVQKWMGRTNFNGV